MKQDVLFALRSLARDKTFTVAALLSLALGVMATTAMYSVIHGVVLHPFAYRDVDRLMSVEVAPDSGGYGRTGYSVDEYLQIAKQNHIFSGTIASSISDVLWQVNGEPRQLRGNPISKNTFDVMGVEPLFGRVVHGGDDDVESLVVLGYRFWQNELGGKADVLGMHMLLNGKVRTVIGVMTLERRLQEQVYARPRFSLALFGIFAALGLAMAALGVYGVLSNLVAQLRVEFSVRMALGAIGGRLTRMVLREGAVLLAEGLALGGALTYAALRWMASRVETAEHFTLADAAVSLAVLTGARLAACLVPALRAAQVNLAQALRAE